MTASGDYVILSLDIRRDQAMAKTKAEPKRPQGRPAREDAPVRLVVRVPGELKRWLAHRAIDEGRDMGRIVTEALDAYRKTTRERGKP